MRIDILHQPRSLAEKRSKTKAEINLRNYDIYFIDRIDISRTLKDLDHLKRVKINDNLLHFFPCCKNAIETQFKIKSILYT